MGGPSTLLRSSRTAWLLALMMAAACGDATVISETGTPAFGKAGAGKPPGDPAVTAVDPPYGHRGETVLGIRILGSGFDQTAVASWERNGVADPAVTVLATRFVSSTEVEADIAIAEDADVAFYDVAVALSSGKRGVGIESFEVTTAENLGVEGFVYAINEQGDVAGYTNTGSCCNATVFQEGAGAISLGSGQAWGVDPLGTMVLGRNGASLATAWMSMPTVWIRQGTTYTAELLPGSGSGAGGNVESGARAADGTLIVAGNDQVPAGAKKSSGTVNRAAVWRRVGTGWAGPELYVTPPGMIGSSIRSVNGNAQAAGVASQQAGVIWENASTFTLIDGIAEAINPAGTIVVGGRNGTPAYWYRNPVTNAWNPTGVTLPSVGGSCGLKFGAQKINGAGIIVGQSCNTSGVGQGTVWQLEFSGASPTLIFGPQALPGLGARGSGSGPVSFARDITETAPYVIGGEATLKGKSVWVRWRLEAAGN